jgi:hypothetical protein
MPPVISALALGSGLTLAGLGLVMLLMLLTTNPRATPTLIWWGRPWPLRTMALAFGVASVLCLMVPRAHWSAGPPRDREADNASPGPRDHEASSHRPGPSAPVAPPVARVPGTLDTYDSPVTFSAPGEPSVAAMTPPAGRVQEAVRRASPRPDRGVDHPEYGRRDELPPLSAVEIRLSRDHPARWARVPRCGRKAARKRPADPTGGEAAPAPPRHGRGGRGHCRHLSGRGVGPAQHRTVSPAAAGPLSSDGDICQHGRPCQRILTLDPDVRPSGAREPA